MTPKIPIQIPRTLALERFLRAFKSTRRIVENALGIIKEKFPCLNHLRVQPIIASKIILSSIVLHNIEKRLGSQHYIPYSEQSNEQDDEVANNSNEDEVFEPEAIGVLQSLIQLFE
jgi:zona occludens toxin (predicted ATPase)